ncbi:MAG: aminomethyl-transferring glycine dehydrogenase subunit GcvPA [Spirochaetia bacterium]|nr:aminomethyl-transferring glycine dehydrogenase subunit GcvPA [Spirochaetia bacterium]
MQPHKYLPVSETEFNQEISELGLKQINDLFKSIPEGLRGDTTTTLAPPMSEVEIRNHFEHETRIAKHTFVGGNGHTHYIPSIISPLVSRGEFLTAYTPYQPEVSQGTLQAMYEFQSMMAGLMGVEISNASLYDGSTAMLEACYMAQRITGKNGMLFSQLIHPEYIETMKTYSKAGIFTYDFIEHTDKGRIDEAKLTARLAENTGALIIQSPNFAGIIEDIAALKKILEPKGILLIVVVTEAMSFGLLKSPGALGADIVCGEAQSLGVPLSFGGPWLGFLGASPNFVRNMPGRLIGEAKDANGSRCFVVTLATREQHIRREKATSNICTNQGLMALRCAIYLSVMGKTGLRRAAERCAKFASLGRKLAGELKGYRVRFAASPIFNEFILETPGNADAIFQKSVREFGIAPGLPIEEKALHVSFHEMHSPEILHKWITALQAAG